MATSPMSNGAAASSNTSMMKEYLRKQLKYWVENFRDDMLPRDFGAKSFSRCTISLHKIELKMHKVGAMLQIPKPLLVTRAYCSEVVIKVPSWTVADKFVQEPLSLRVVDLFIDIKSATDCDDVYRRAYDARVQAAVMEPDPLGSIASWYTFSTILSERAELVIDNVYVKVFARGVSRVRVELANFHSRTTNALWQDMRDLTHCVDRSPDGLLKTRFKFVSFSCSVLLTQSADGNDAQRPKTPPPPLKVLHDHTVTMRMTLFGHRQSKNESWETLSQVVDVNLHVLTFEYDIAELLHIYEICMTVCGWLREAAEHERATAAAGAGLNQSMLLRHQQHKLQRAAVLTPQSSESERTSNEVSFALQLTFRFSATVTLRFVSERLGKQYAVLAVQHAAVNAIVHHDSARELQVTVHEVRVHFQDRVVLFLKPKHDVMQLKQLRDSVFVKWHVQRLTCRIDGDLALVLNEAYHAHNEKAQSAFIKCGTCLQQVRLESIETHVCSAPAPSSMRSSAVSANVRHPSQNTSSSSNNARGNSAASLGHDETSRGEGAGLDSAPAPRLRLVFTLDELELSVDSHLFHTVQQLMRTLSNSSSNNSSSGDLASRTFAVHMTALSVTTESKEFVGDAIFVPVLPLAFQMLECTLQGCGCIRTRAGANGNSDDSSTAANGSSVVHADERCSRTWVQLPRWPERIFIELARVKCTAKRDGRVLQSLQSESEPTQPDESGLIESFAVAESLSLRASFSDGVRICINCHPQVSAHACVDRVRCQLDDAALRMLQRAVRDAVSAHEHTFVVAQTLFFAVLELRTVEFTLLHAANAALARLKSLFKHVSVVGDNQLGHLALQSSLAFRSLINSHVVRFVHRRAAAVAPVTTPVKMTRDNDSQTSGADARDEHASSAGLVDSQLQSQRLTKQRSRRIRQEQERQCAVRPIQRLVRRVQHQHRQRVACSFSIAGAESAPTAESPANSSSVAASDSSEQQCTPSSTGISNTADRNNSSQALEPQRPASPKRKSSSSAAAALFGVPEDLLNANRKVVAAASVITNFVKTKHQQLESEVVGLATQSKESAARLVLPPYSAYKKMFGRGSPTARAAKANGSDQQQQEFTTDKQEEARAVAAQAGTSSRSDSASSMSRTLTIEQAELTTAKEMSASERQASVRLSQDQDQGGSSERLDSVTRDHSSRSIHDERVSCDADSNEPLNTVEDESGAAPLATDPLGQVNIEQDSDNDVETTDEQHASDEDTPNDDLDREDTSQGFIQPEHGLSDELLASLPSLMRVLVQVGEHRMRVPINPRERVGFLCREVVRRFNELFAAQNNARILYVALQDARGGVFAPTDIVGFVYASESEVLFAFPRTADERIRCVAHVEPSGEHELQSSEAALEADHRRSAAPRDAKMGKALGSKFARCSQLPLPLAIALLANESERDLLRCVLREGSYGAAGGGHADEWPELALNVSFLDPRHILPVEVRWFGRCLEVTNADAFVLCLQQLGLCTARASSKYVGKILRDRLKMDAKNAFIRSACLRSGGDFTIDDETESSEGDDTFVHTAASDRENGGRAAVSYESLKEIVQEDYGVYVTPPKD